MVQGMVAAYRIDPATDPSKELGKLKKDGEEESKTQAEEERRQNIRLKQGKVVPLYCQSVGHLNVAPLVTRENANEEYVAWSTDRGYMNIGRIDRKSPTALALKYRLQTEAPIVCRPAYWPPESKTFGASGVILSGSRDGYVHAILETTGEALWRFSTGEPIAQVPAVIDDRVYVATQLSGMHCLEARTGKDLWWAPNVMQFVAASKDRVYAVDQIGRILVLDAKNGARLDTLPTQQIPIKLANSASDRIFLADDSGLIQCLHEIELAKPLLHGEDRKRVEEGTPEKPAVEPKAVPEKPAKKEHAAPKEPAAPREHAAPKEKPAPKERPLKKEKKSKKGDLTGQDAGNVFNPGGANAGPGGFAPGGAAPGGAMPGAKKGLKNKAAQGAFN